MTSPQLQDSAQLCQCWNVGLDCVLSLQDTFVLHPLVYSFPFPSRLEPIGAAASKEYSLEKNMEKMKSEWANIYFTFVKYRDTVRK